MIKAPDPSAGITEIPAQTKDPQLTPHHDVANMQGKDLQQLVHELQARQTELEIQNEKLRQAQTESYGFSPFGQLTLDTQGKIIAANLRAATLVGIDREKLIGQPFIRFVAQDSQDIFHWHCQKVLKIGARQSCEMQLQKKTGAPHWVHLESLAADREPGPVTHWQMALLDISERKRAEGGLRLANFSMERAADAVYWIGPQAQILDVNEAASLMLGYSKDELCAMTVHDLNPDFQSDMWPGFWAETQRHGTMVVETAHRAKNGRLIPIEVSVNYLFHEGKEYHCAFVRNITERKGVEEELLRSQKLITSVLENLPDMIFVKDAKDLKFVRVNKAGENLLGYSREVLIGKTDHDIFTKEEADFFTATDRQVLESGCLLDIKDEPIETKDQGRRILHTKKIPICDDKGEPQYLLGISEDITDRKQAEDALRATKEKLHQVLFASKTGLWDWNIETNEVFFSREWRSQLGYGEEELANAFEVWETLLYADDKERTMAYIRTYLKNPVGDYLQEFRLRHKDGSYRWIASAASFVAEPDGRRVRLLGSHTDITEQKRLEAQFRQAQKMDAVGRLAGGVAHDFNNLLTVINGYSSLLIDRLPQEDPRHEMAVETLKAGERAAELTKQLLAFSRKQVLMPQPLNFNDSLRLISSMLNRLLDEQVTLTMDLALDLWSINGDKGQINQVTMNLAINARDAMPNGGTLTIATRNLSVTHEWPDRYQMMQQGDYVHVSVHDTGHGMSAETLSHLFEPFFTTKEVGQGTGLGLATVYGIVKQSQGYIFADSALDQGTTFHLYYPRVIATPAVAKTQLVRSGKGSESILVIEDQDAVRTLIVQALKQDGYQVIEAASGEEALRVAASLPEPIQALVTDVIMPHMSGLVVAERLNSIWPDTRVLFMPGYVDATKPWIFEEPGTAFIQKPFLPDDLIRCLRDLLDRPI